MGYLVRRLFAPIFCSQYLNQQRSFQNLIALKQPFSYVSISEAWNRISGAAISSLESEIVTIREAHNRILAKEVISPISIPADDLTHYDGYAIRSVDTKNADVQPVRLRVVDKAYPSQPPKFTIGDGEACYVTTGSALPRGSDTVLAVEMAARMEGDLVQVRSRIDPGEHVIRAGSDIKKGEVVISAGRTLRPQDIMVLGLLKIETVQVYKKPFVAIVSVGDELVDKAPTHSLLLSHWVQLSGGIPIDSGVAPDDLVQIKDRVEAALTRADVVITIGGCSMGEKDLVGDAINSVGKPGLVFHGIKMKPGRVSGFGVAMNKPIVMLPGFIHSTIVGFEFLVLPLLQKMRRLHPEGAWDIITAKLAEKIQFRSFIPFKNATFVRLERGPEGLMAYPMLGDSSFFGIVSKADGVVVGEENRTSIDKGETVSVHILPGV